MMKPTDLGYHAHHLAVGVILVDPRCPECTAKLPPQVPLNRLGLPYKRQFDIRKARNAARAALRRSHKKEPKT